MGKRPRTSGPSVGVLIAASGLGFPRVTVISSRNADLNDKEVEIVLTPSIALALSTTISVSRAAEMVVSTLGHLSGALGRVSATPGAAGAPPSFMRLRASGGSSAQGRVEMSSAQQGVEILVKSPSHQISVSWRRVDGGWIYRVHVGEGDLMLHNLAISRGLFQVMLLSRDFEELDS